MNPGKIVDPPRMDDRDLFRYPPGYREREGGRSLPVVLDWSSTDGFLGATERCNNNGACRSYGSEVMCPSFRITDDERHSTRGRANALRLALTGQLGSDALDSPRNGRGDGAVRVVQGVPAGVPHRRRHGAHEARMDARAQRPARRSACATGWSRRSRGSPRRRAASRP